MDRFPRGLALGFFLGLLVLAPVAPCQVAEDGLGAYAPGGLVSATSLGISPLWAIGSDSYLGLEARLDLDVELRPRPLDVGLGASYRWLYDPWGGVYSLVDLGLECGYRLRPLGPIGLRPRLGLGYGLALGQGNPFGSGLRAKASVDALLRLSGGDYLCLSPAVDLGPWANLPTVISISVSSRKENYWAKRIKAGAEPEPKPSPQPTPKDNPKPDNSPSPWLSVEPSLFSPDDDGQDDVLRIGIRAKKFPKMRDWAIKILDEGGLEFAHIDGSGLDPQDVEWKGLGDAGQLVDPGKDYRVRLEYHDAQGRAQSLESSFTVDILVMRDGDRYKIRVPDIRFPSFSASLGPDVGQALLADNRAVLTRIASLFSRFPDYSMTVEGYANATQWRDPKAFQSEQANELIPLSSQRAEAVRQALISLGIDPKRIKAIGLGGTRPIVPFGDETNAYKNRRVEFTLSRRVPGM